jgi:hypothetical protein
MLITYASKTNRRDHKKKSIESVIQEVREERARSEGQSVDRIKPYKESFVYKLCNLWMHDIKGIRTHQTKSSASLGFVRHVRCHFNGCYIWRMSRPVRLESDFNIY